MKMDEYQRISRKTEFPARGNAAYTCGRNYSLSPLTANSLFQVSKHNPLGIRILVQSARGGTGSV